MDCVVLDDEDLYSDDETSKTDGTFLFCVCYSSEGTGAFTICQLGGRYVLTVCTLRCAADVRRERRKLEFEKDVSRFQLQVGITPLDTCVGREPVMYRLPKKLCKRQVTRETDGKLKIDCKLNAHYWIFLNTAPCVSHC